MAGSAMGELAIEWRWALVALVPVCPLSSPRRAGFAANAPKRSSRAPEHDSGPLFFQAADTHAALAPDRPPTSRNLLSQMICDRSTRRKLTLVPVSRILGSVP